MMEYTESEMLAAAKAVVARGWSHLEQQVVDGAVRAIISDKRFVSCDRDMMLMQCALTRAEAENKALRERPIDLLRHQRHELLQQKLISQEEYAALVADSQSGERVARLEKYDETRQRAETAEAELARLRTQVDEARELLLEAQCDKVLFSQMDYAAAWRAHRDAWLAANPAKEGR